MDMHDFISRENCFFRIYEDGNPILRTTCKALEMPLNEEYEAILCQMVEHLKNSQNPELAEKYNVTAGVGLAAPQIGIDGRFFAVYFKKDGIETKYAIANPKITYVGTKMCARITGEGCLSVKTPHSGFVPRHLEIILEGYDALSKKNIVINASGYEAICIQHEYDHLDGILYYDRIDKTNPMDPKNLIMIENIRKKTNVPGQGE